MIRETLKSIKENRYSYSSPTVEEFAQKMLDLKEENTRLKELNRGMENALIEIKEYWGGREEGALDAIQHVKEIAEWILAKVRGEGG